MKFIKIVLAGTLSQITKKLSLELYEGNDVITVFDVLNKVDKIYNNKILPEIKNNFSIMFTKDEEPSKLITLDQIDEIKLGKNNLIKFFYRFTGG